MPVIYTSYKPEVMQKIKQAKASALEICGGKAEGYAKQACPVQTGVLRNSIAHEQRNENTEAIGTGVEYAPYVEYGHNQEPGRYVPALGKRLVASHVAAKPYMTPALDHASEYQAIFVNEMSKI